MEENMVIWRDTPVRILDNKPHVHKIGGKLCRCTHRDFGDLPVANFNGVTKKIEAVVNNRGYGYAARSRFSYRRRRNVVKGGNSF